MQLLHFWKALETLGGQAAVEAEWRALTGPEFDRIGPLLRPCPELATSYPRLPPSAWGPPFEVVTHGPDDFVGVCPETGELRPLARADLVVYELDVPKLLGHLATVIGVERSPGAGRMDAYQVGNYRPTAGFAFPTFLTIPVDADGFSATVHSLLASYDTAFFLLAPTRRSVPAEALAVLQRRRSWFVDLSEAVTIADSGSWTATPALTRSVADFCAANLPGSNTACAFFPTPSNATWEHLKIRFVDGDTLVATVGEVTRALNFAQMGMADGRSGRPTKQWELLRAFARGLGNLSWDSPDAGPKKQKRRELLAQDLKAFFRIAGEPIVWLPDGRRWQTAFPIEGL